MLTIAPRRSSRCGIAARAARNAPVTLTRNTSSNLRLEVVQRADSTDAGVEDERVEAAEAVDGLGNGANGIVRDARVGDDGEAVHLGRDLLDRAAPSAGDRHLVPVHREPARHGRPDAGAAARDEGDLGHERMSFTISWSSTV